MELSKIDWKNTLYFKDIKIYLDFLQIIELSMSTKSLRNNIIYNSFDCFYFNGFFKLGNYENFQIEKKPRSIIYSNPFDEPSNKILGDIDRFESDLKVINHSVKKFILRNLVDYLYSYKVVDCFNNITVLQLSFCTIPVKLLQYMLNNLKLTQLAVEAITVFNNEPSFKVNLPQSLVKFKFITCNSRIYESGGPIEIMKSNYFEIEQIFYFEPSNIKSLKYLHYNNPITDAFNFNQFLLFNPQLISITACPATLYLINLQLIHSNNRANHLEIIHYQLTQFPDDEFPIFNGLKSLKIDDYRHSLYNFNLFEFFPNLTRLSISFQTIKEVYEVLNSLDNMLKLKFFTLKLRNLVNYDYKLNFSYFKDLEILEFYEFIPEDLDWEKLNELPNLRIVKFYGKYAKTSKKPFHSKIDNIENWNLTYYNNSITYHKV